MKKSQLQEDLMETSLDDNTDSNLIGAVNPVYSDAIKVHKKKKLNTRKFIKDADEISKQRVKEGRVLPLPENRISNVNKLTLDENLFENFSIDTKDIKKRRIVKKLSESMRNKSRRKNLMERTAKPENLDLFDKVQDDLRGDYPDKVAKSRAVNPEGNQKRYTDNQILIRPRDHYIEIMTKTEDELDFAKTVAKKYNIPFIATKYNSYYNPYKVGIRMQFNKTNESYKMKRHNRRLQEADRETYSDLDRAFSRARERGLKPVDYAPVKGVRPTINYARFNRSGRPEDESELDAYYSDTDNGLIHNDVKRLRNINKNIKFADYEDNASDEDLDTEVRDSTRNFTKNDGSIRTYTQDGKTYITRLLRRYYKYVDVADGRMGRDEPLSWVISYSDKKNFGESFRKNKNKRNSKLVEKRVLNEGPGAGYTLSGKIKASNVKDIKINNIKETNNLYGSAEVDFDCDIDGEIEDFSFYSYMYGDEVESAPINIYHMYGTILNDLPNGETSFEDYLNNHMNELRDGIDGYLGKTDYVYGGGWGHSTFDGTISEKDSYLSDVDSYDSTIYCGDLMIGIDSIDAEITDDEIINYVDKAVLGDNEIESYVVFDSNDNQSDVFEDLDSAIDYAKEINGTKVIKFYETQNFDGDVELDDSEIVWEKDNDFEESLKRNKSKSKFSLKNLFIGKNKNKRNSKLVEKKVLDEDFKEDMGRKIERLARNAGISVNLSDGDDSLMGAFRLDFTVYGDWKHDHLAFNKIVENLLKGDNKYSLWRIDEKQNDEIYLSDTYDSTHSVYIVPTSKLDTLKELSVLFSESKAPKSKIRNNRIDEDLQVTYETDLTDFEFWSGAKDTVEELTDSEIITISHILEDSYPEGMSETDINDFFWFERDTIAEWLGYDSFDDLMNNHK